MASILRCLLIVAAVTSLAAQSTQQRFYPDDPLWAVPPPVSIEPVKERDIDALYDFMFQSFRSKEFPARPAGGINTLGEVPDSDWFTNRHAKKRMTREELQRGPGTDHRPVPPFTVTGAKTQGITPGFQMRDAQKRLFFVKTDPLSNPEIGSAADVIGSKFFYALGYNTPENYILNLKREEITVAEDAELEVAGRERRMNAKDLDLILDSVPRTKDSAYRLLASLAVEGKPVGPFRYEGTRTDDPNDIVRHELRRDLRGLYVFAAWLNHTDSKAGNTLDVMVEQNGVRFIRHFLIDFGASLGSDSDMAKNARYGHQYIFPEGGDALKRMASLGLYSPAWERADYPDLKAVGRFEAKTFDPETWTSNYPNPAFLSRQPEDELWAAKQLMAFTDEDIRTIVETGEYSDSRAVDYIVTTLIERRERIGKAFLTKLLALDNFRVSGGNLTFDDLAVKRGYAAARRYRYRWTSFNNRTGEHTVLPGETTAAVPAMTDANGYLAVMISGSDAPRKTVTVYLRNAAEGMQIVGIDR